MLKTIVSDDSVVTKIKRSEISERMNTIISDIGIRI